MELRICPGWNKLYRLALVGPGERFEALSEHDTPEAAVSAKLRAQAASDDALAQLNNLMRTPA